MPRVIPQSLVLSSLLPSLPHPACSKLHAATGTTLNLTTPLYDRFPDEGTEARERRMAGSGPCSGPSGELGLHAGPSVPARTQPIIQGLASAALWLI